MPKDRFKRLQQERAVRVSEEMEYLEERIRKRIERNPRLITPRWREAYKWIAEVKRRKPQSSTDCPPIDAIKCHGGPTAEYQEKPRTSHTTGKVNTQGQGVYPGSENESLAMTKTVDHLLR